MILPSRLPRRKSSTPSPETNGAGTIPATEDVALPALEFENDVRLNAKGTEAALDEMKLQYTEEGEDRPPIYVFTGYGWREPTRAEALAMTIPFQDPEDPPRVQFGMGLRDCNGQISPYVRTENDDVCVAPSELMQVNTGTVVEADAIGDPTAITTNPLEIPKTPVKRKSTKRTKSPPLPLMSVTPSRKRKTPSSPSKTRERRQSVNIASTSNLSSIAESPDEPQASTSYLHNDSEYDSDTDDQATLVGSPLKRPARSPPHSGSSPPRKMRPPTSTSNSSSNARPPHSSGKASSPLKPKAATTFAGYQCQMPGCTFTASSPQHIKHHYESFQHGRVTRGASRWEG